MAIKSKIKGKKKKRNYPSSKKSTKYKIVDGKIVRSKYCPRCGPGIFLMEAKDRDYCGRCHYTAFNTKK